MNRRLQNILNNTGGNYVFPFFWQHGEDEETLRHYMDVIEKSNCKAVCVESRPHPDFCGPLWWRDMDIILDEARSRNMKVWILDDSHFPTGFANGAMRNKSDSLRRRSICCKIVDCVGGTKIRLDEDALVYHEQEVLSPIELLLGVQRRQTFIKGDRLLGIAASGSANEYIDLTAMVRGNTLEWDVPQGFRKIYILHITPNAGYHPDYINMMDSASCKILIDAVYEPHYARYKNDFGKTIAGFFSDEPELGNGHLYAQYNRLGTEQDLPWSSDLEARLREAWKADFVINLPLLWGNDAEPERIADTRLAYMDAVTRLFERDFSQQIGDWCRAHHVEYIGHIIEDNNQHSRTGSSPGHFFRSMTGQDMAGIDCIGNQVLPGGEDDLVKGNVWGDRDGEFYHYVLAKLGASYASIDPAKKGRCMCEIFGNYDWSAGVRLEKYLVDHFLVRGVNQFVPHAFSPKAFPDPDCPPHFYAHGHNPQYRYFGALMVYTNRVCELINGGRHIAPLAVLYHAEAEWCDTSNEYMLMQKPCHLLADAQIDYDIIPQDVFTETKRYNTRMGKTLQVNNQTYRAVVVPGTRYITAACAEAAVNLQKAGFPVIFVDRPPEYICGHSKNNSRNALINELKKCMVIPLGKLTGFLRDMGIPEISISPANNRIRYLHYLHEDGVSLYMFVNEGSAAYRGTITLKEQGSRVKYNAWDNCLETIDSRSTGMRTDISAEIEPLKSLIVIFDGNNPGGSLKKSVVREGKKINLPNGWVRSICEGSCYPAFEKHKSVSIPDALEKEEPDFSGFVRYENRFLLEATPPGSTFILEITDACEGVEVFVNGQSLGLQIAPPFLYDISRFVRLGDNSVIIEVATTLERQLGLRTRLSRMKNLKPSSKSGICGEVNLYIPW
ncbi:MAG: hypothetical protein LBH90_08130 [Tannerella sp.]|jgi:hypothetical protein|nr:hypothetical protein [Tannerella sp.]